MNIYNINVWLDPADPGSLIKSIEWHFVDWPVTVIDHAPSCVAIFASAVNKELGFCFSEAVYAT